MLAVSVRAPLVVAGALTAALLGIAADHQDAPAPHRTVVACGPAPSMAMPDGVYATLKTLGDPPPEPWAPVGCNADTPDVELAVDFDIVGQIATVGAIDPVHPAGACMQDRVATRIANLRALHMPVTFDHTRVRAYVTVHAQDPDSVFARLSILR